MKTSVSVVIPSYNRAKLLVRALRSVQCQTRPPEQVIVVDDASDDDTRLTVEQHYPAANYLRQSTNSGVSVARNRGIAAASGEWIALLDSDDEWLPDKLERQLAALAACPPRPRMLLCHSDEIWIRNGRRVNPMRKHQKRGGYIFQHCLPLCAISPSSVLMHRDLLQEVGLFDPSLPACEDYDLWLRICAHHPVLLVDQPLIVKYGGHDDQLSRRYWGMDRFRIRALVKLLEQSIDLSPVDRHAAKQTLRQKIDIYTQGAHKRGRQAEVEQYHVLRDRWATQ